LRYGLLGFDVAPIADSGFALGAAGLPGSG
jgi:hypothetical protein